MRKLNSVSERFGSNRAWDRRPVLVVALLVLATGVGLFAQTRQQSPVPQSELARQNMARVAASTGQLVGILHKDPGLMVELKRWIAKDATDHGQLISDSDLTEEAVFSRLESDISFRSTATFLVQKYGYLQPTVDPESSLGKQEDLLMKERVKWIAQEEEEDRAQSRQQFQQKAVQQAQGCDNRNGNCPGPSGTNPSIQELQQLPGMNQGPMQVPGMQMPQGLPNQLPQRTAPTNDMTDLLRTGTPESSVMEQLQAGSGMGASLRLAQGDDAGLGGGLSSRSSLSALQGRSPGAGGSQFEDLSLSSDFVGDRGGQDRYPGAFPNDGMY